METNDLKIDGLKISYWQENWENGKGKPVVFWHGWGGSKESWNDLRLEMKDMERKLLAIDLPGFGDSDLPKTAFEVKDYVEIMQKFLEKDEKIEKFDLIIHSFGGRMALKAFEYEFFKNRINKLVIIAGAGIKRPLSFRQKSAKKIAKFGRKFLKNPIFEKPVLNKIAGLMKKIVYKISGSRDYLNLDGVMRETFKKVIKEDLTANLEKINVPTLIVWGDQDKYVPVKDAKLMKEKITISELKIIQGGRHGIHRTKAKTIAEWLKVFL